MILKLQSFKVQIHRIRSLQLHDVNDINNLGELYDILAPQDVEWATDRLRHLKSILPDSLSRYELNEIVLRHPILLSLDTDKITEAMMKMEKAIPFVDMSYLLKQHSPGIELLIQCLSPSFDLEEQYKELSMFLDINKVNPKNFVRRVPYALAPRYRLALTDHCMVLQEELGYSSKEALGIIMKWPAVLVQKNLRTNIGRLEVALLNAGMIDLKNESKEADNNSIDVANAQVNRKMLSKLVGTVPRVLRKDTPRRIQHLRKSFPNWKLKTVIWNYPRVMTQDINKIRDRCAELQSTFDHATNAKIDVDKLINVMPSMLSRNVDQLIENANMLQQLLPDAKLEYILSKAPILIANNVTEAVKPKLNALNKVFIGVVEDHNRRQRISSTTFDLDFSRLVMGNIAIFESSFPRLKNGCFKWVRNYDPATAFCVLNAVPSLVVRKPESYEPTLKFLYACCADSNIAERHEGGTYFKDNYYNIKYNGISSVNNKGNTENVNDDDNVVEAEELLSLYDTSISAALRSPTLTTLNEVLQDAPGLLKVKAKVLQKRRDWIAKKLKLPWVMSAIDDPTDDTNSDADNKSISLVEIQKELDEMKTLNPNMEIYFDTSNAEKKGNPQTATTMSTASCASFNFDASLFARAPRVFLEKENRLIFRLAALLYVTGGNENNDHGRRCLLTVAPAVITMPLSLLCRIPFIRKVYPSLHTNIGSSYILNRDARWAYLLSCNTDKFISTLSNIAEIDDLKLQRNYAHFLKGVLGHCERSQFKQAGESIEVEVRETINSNGIDKSLVEIYERQLCGYMNQSCDLLTKEADVVELAISFGNYVDK